jgi:hypothetical protein
VSLATRSKTDASQNTLSSIWITLCILLLCIPSTALAMNYASAVLAASYTIAFVWYATNPPSVTVDPSRSTADPEAIFGPVDSSSIAYYNLLFDKAQRPSARTHLPGVPLIILHPSCTNSKFLRICPLVAHTVRHTRKDVSNSKHELRHWKAALARRVGGLG